jgi:hypothetical protein
LLAQGPGKFHQTAPDSPAGELVQVVERGLAHAGVNLLAGPVSRKVIAVRILLEHCRTDAGAFQHRAEQLVAGVVTVGIDRRRVRVQLLRPGGDLADRVERVIKFGERHRVRLLVPDLRKPLVVGDAGIGEDGFLPERGDIGGEQPRPADVSIGECSENIGDGRDSVQGVEGHLLGSAVDRAIGATAQGVVILADDAAAADE